MNRLERLLLGNLLPIAIMSSILGCKSHPVVTPPSPTAVASAHLPLVGGQKAIELRRLQSGTGAKQEFISNHGLFAGSRGGAPADFSAARYGCKNFEWQRP